VASSDKAPGQGTAVRDKGPLPILLALAALVGLPVLIAVAVLGVFRPLLTEANEDRVSERCMGRLSKLAQAASVYAADADGRYPPASAWMDALVPYASKKDPENESESVFRCPSISALRTGDYGYAFLSEASGEKALTKDGEPRLLFFDSALMDRNASSGPETLPKPPRHKGTTQNFGVLEDGTIRSFH
jgi:hypothetical protein